MEYKVKLDIQNEDKVQTLLTLLDKYRGSLPDELINSLNGLADCEACEFDCGSLQSMGLSGVRLFSDGVEIQDVTSFNLILKRVTSCWNHEGEIQVVGEEIPEIYTWPQSLDVICDGVKIESLSW